MISIRLPGVWIPCYSHHGWSNAHRLVFLARKTKLSPQFCLNVKSPLMWNWRAFCLMITFSPPSLRAQTIEQVQRLNFRESVLKLFGLEFDFIIRAPKSVNQKNSSGLRIRFMMFSVGINNSVCAVCSYSVKEIIKPLHFILEQNRSCLYHWDTF